MTKAFGKRLKIIYCIRKTVDRSSCSFIPIVFICNLLKQTQSQVFIHYIFLLLLFVCLLTCLGICYTDSWERSMCKKNKLICPLTLRTTFWYDAHREALRCVTAAPPSPAARGQEPRATRLRFCFLSDIRGIDVGSGPLLLKLWH